MLRLSVYIKSLVLAAATLAVTVAGASSPAALPAPMVKPRVFVLTDIGNEPDDQMSLVRLLTYSNSIDIEGLVASTSTWKRTIVSPETIRSVIEAYGQVRPNLALHETGWPTQEHLLTLVSAGRAAYGLAGLVGGEPSEGALRLVEAARRTDPRPLWITLWGGASTLAEALTYARNTLPAEQLEAMIRNLRVYSISDQDDAGPWIRREFPQLAYIVKPSPADGAEYGSATWTGISGDAYYRNGEGADSSTVSQEWLQANIRSKGALGAHYPKHLFIMEGDTPSYLGLIPNGLNSDRNPGWGGWGGRYVWRQPYGESHPVWTQGGDAFTRVTSADTVTGADGKPHTSDQATIWRWRTAFQNDFAARMDWTIHDFAHANHAPHVVVNGDASGDPVDVDVTVGATTMLDAAGTTDPDNDAMDYTWLHYGEAGLGTAPLAAVSIEQHGTTVLVRADATCQPAWLPLLKCGAEGVAHVILAVTDHGTPALTRYRRVIVHVHAAASSP